MASQDVVQVTNTTNSTTENTSVAQRHLQEIAVAQLKEDSLVASTDIVVAQLKDSSKISKNSTTTGNSTEASTFSRKRKAQSHTSAVTIRANEKNEVSESVGTTIGKRNNKTKTQDNITENSEPSSSSNQKRHKLAVNTTFSSDSSVTTSKLSPSQSDGQEDKAAKNPSNEGTATRRRRHATDKDKPKAVPIERPRRSVRPVVPYGSETAEQKVRNKKPIEISQGSGLPLSQIPHVLRAIDKMKTSNDVLKGLHKLIYGRMGSKHDIKNHIRAFSGFKIQTPLDEIVLKEKLEKWKIAGLKDICHLFGLKSSGDKQKVVDRVYDFLKNPRDMTAPNEENGKGKGKSGKKKRSAAVKMKTIIIRRKTARDMFNIEKRPFYKKKAENQSKTRAEIDNLIAEAWRNLAEDDKKSYAEKAEEANRNEPQQKRQVLSNANNTFFFYKFVQIHIIFAYTEL
jgi:hypothetical protein